MKRLIYNDKALHDFNKILDRITLVYRNPPAAVELGEAFIATCKLIAKNPEMGVRKGKDQTQRMFTCRGYAIYYRNLDDTVRIQRFLHPKLDVRRQELD